MAKLLALLANKNRLLILSNLQTYGELSVGSLADAVKLRQSALSQHLAKLRANNVVGTRRDGRRLLYHIAHSRSGSYVSKLLKQLRG
jgi:DNA-binding transcriptional ArsR family regulator